MCSTEKRKRVHGPRKDLFIPSKGRSEERKRKKECVRGGSGSRCRGEGRRRWRRRRRGLEMEANEVKEKGR